MICRYCKKELPDGAAFCCWCGKRLTPSERKKRTMPNGAGSVFKLPNGKWRAQVTIYHHGVRVATRTKSGFTTKKDALAYLPELRNMETHEVVTVSELWDVITRSASWEAMSKSRQVGLNGAWKKCVSLADRDIRDVKYLELQELVDAVPGKSGVKLLVKSVLSKIWTLAIKQEIIDKDIVHFIEVRQTDAAPRDARTPEEMASIWADWHNGYEVSGYALIMAYTGARIGELKAMPCTAIDLARQCMIGGEKTEAGKNREMPLADIILPVVQALMGAETLLPWDDNRIYREWAKMIERTGIRDLPPHCQRHTCATRLGEIVPAVGTDVIKSILGHASNDITSHYTHIGFEAKLDAVNRMKMVPDDK